LIDEINFRGSLDLRITLRIISGNDDFHVRSIQDQINYLPVIEIDLVISGFRKLDLLGKSTIAFQRDGILPPECTILYFLDHNLTGLLKYHLTSQGYRPRILIRECFLRFLFGGGRA